MRGRRRVTEARLKGHVSCASAKLFAVSLSGGHYHPRRLDATSKILEKQKEQKKNAAEMECTRCSLDRRMLSYDKLNLKFYMKSLVSKYNLIHVS
jgi:hypothetical protein